MIHKTPGKGKGPSSFLSLLQLTQEHSDVSFQESEITVLYFLLECMQLTKCCSTDSSLRISVLLNANYFYLDILFTAAAQL